MPNVALSWQQAAALAAVLAVLAAVLHAADRPRLRAVGPIAWEAGIIAALYALWQFAGSLSVTGSGGALARARWIENTEQALHLPSEAAVQRIVTANPTVAQAANIYYATMHFGVLFVFLLWLFLRHRDRYRPIRRTLAVTTFVCLIIQLVPVAPPRMLPGFVDTARQYGQSVYALGFDADQFSAMPSVHVAWAALVAWAVWRIASGPGRWLGVAHLMLTVIVVVATANHFWADGIVAVAVLAASYGVVRLASRAADSVRDLRSTPSPSPELSSTTDGAILS